MTSSRNVLPEIIIAALAFTLAFAWNEFFISAIDTSIEPQKRLRYKFFYALLFSIITIFIIYLALKYV